MKTLKKSLFTIGLAFSMILGVAFSFAPQDSVAQSSISVGVQKISQGGGDKIPCWSAGGGLTMKYVNCGPCTLGRGKPSGGKGFCTN